MISAVLALFRAIHVRTHIETESMKPVKEKNENKKRSAAKRTNKFFWPVTFSCSVSRRSLEQRVKGWSCKTGRD